MAGMNEQSMNNKWPNKWNNNNNNNVSHYSKHEKTADKSKEHEQLVEELSAKTGMDKQELIEATYVLDGKLQAYGTGYNYLLAKIVSSALDCSLFFAQPEFSVSSITYVFEMQKYIRQYIYNMFTGNENPDLVSTVMAKDYPRDSDSTSAQRFEKFHVLPIEWLSEFKRRPELFQEKDLDLFIPKEQPIITRLKLGFRVRNMKTGAIEHEDYVIYEPDYTKSDITNTKKSVRDHLTKIMITRAKAKCYESFLSISKLNAFKIPRNEDDYEAEEKMAKKIEQNIESVLSNGNAPKAAPLIGKGAIIDQDEVILPDTGQ